MAARVLQGNVFDLLPTLAPGSVDCAVTSPPYWMLRSYLAKDHPLKALELGSERTPGEYVANMVRVFHLVRECLADHGTLWLNCGDSYATGCSGPRVNRGTLQGTPNSATTAQGFGRKDEAGIDAGNMCLIPWRLAIALQDDGWLVRSVVCWHKPAPMPASVAGWRWVRCRVKVGKKRFDGRQQDAEFLAAQSRIHLSDGDHHAQWSDCPGCKKCSPHGGYVLRKGSWRPTSSWEPVLLLAKKQGYYCDGDAVKQPPAAATVSRDQYTRVLDDPDEQFVVKHDHETVCDLANLRDVWTIASEPLRAAHYAAFPTELVHRCLKAGTSARGYCPACGLPWSRVVNVRPVPHPEPRSKGRAVDSRGGNQGNGSAALAPETETVGWRPSCGCPEQEPRPGLVLDPFCGSGRTGIEAVRLGLDFVGCELNESYVDMARRLLREESPLFAS